ncbi:MAG: AAA family ATPase [Candidatus Falkowbacteria bacterium]|nr:AAA family ATPase [Candidatus Falkowbacteria bacterium]
MIVIGLVGPLSAGKGRVSEYIVNKYGASRHGFSDSLRDAMDRLQIEKNRVNFQDLSTFLRQRFGEDLLAKAMAKDIREDNHEYIVVEGIRREADIAYLKEIPNFHLVAIDADIKLRYERLVKRSQNTDDDNKTFEEFVEDHKREADASVPILMTKAEFQIDNNGSEEDLDKQINSIIEKIKQYE